MEEILNDSYLTMEIVARLPLKDQLALLHTSQRFRQLLAPLADQIDQCMALPNPKQQLRFCCENRRFELAERILNKHLPRCLQSYRIACKPSRPPKDQLSMVNGLLLHNHHKVTSFIDTDPIYWYLSLSNAVSDHGIPLALTILSFATHLGTARNILNT
jgi:hypothetical protein